MLRREFHHSIVLTCSHVYGSFSGVFEHFVRTHSLPPKRGTCRC